MAVSVGSFPKVTILTGAGFSKNWRGLLSADFFSRLIGPQSARAYPKIRALLLQNPNFEVVLHTVRTQGFPPCEVKKFEEAILDVYLDHDSAIRRAIFTGPSDVNIYGVRKFLSRFFRAGTGYLFTLNQDLLLERKFCPVHAPSPTLPGVSKHENWFTSVFDNEYRDSLPPDYQRSVPAASVIPKTDWPPKLSGQFNYIKLHGSFDWRDPVVDSKLLVIGGGKAQAIAASPLLQWYSDVFREVCLSGDVKLLVSGYSFSDENINGIIADGVKNAGLGVFIHDTLSDVDMQQRLSAARYGPEIWSGLIGYLGCELLDIFPGTQDRTSELEAIEQALFS